MKVKVLGIPPFKNRIHIKEFGPRRETPILWIQFLKFKEEKKNAFLSFFKLCLERLAQCYFITNSLSPVLVICVCCRWTSEARNASVLKSVLLNRKTKGQLIWSLGYTEKSWVHLTLPWHLTQTEDKCLAEKQRRTLSAEKPFCAHTACKLCWVMQLFWGQWCFVNIRQSSFAEVWGPFTN